MDEKTKANGAEYVIDQAEWEAATGVGAVITPQMIEDAISKLFADNAEAIKAEGHDFNFSIFLNKMKDIYKWADGGLVRSTIDKKKLEVCGAAPEQTDVKKKKVVKAVAEVKKTEEKKEEDEPKIDITQLIGRDVDAGNSSELLAKHRAFTGVRS